MAGDNQFTVGEDGVLSLTAAQNNVESLTLIVQVGDKSEGGSLPVRVGYTLNGDTYTVFQQGGSSRVTVGYTLLVGEELRFEPDKLAATITTYDSGLVIHTVEAWAASAILLMPGYPPIRRLWPPTLTSVPTTARFVFNNH